MGTRTIALGFGWILMACASSTGVGGGDTPEAGADRDRCDRETPVIKAGCVETSTPPTLSVSGTSTRAVSYTCDAEAVDSIVRIRARVSGPTNPCIADAGEDYAAVVDVPAAALANLSGASTLILDGTTNFTFQSPLDFAVKPENVVYVPGQPTQASRVWMEKTCFCTPVPPLTGMQAVAGTLRIDSATAGRMTGRLTLSADGHIAPTNFSRQQIAVDAFFDVAIDPSHRASGR